MHALAGRFRPAASISSTTTAHFLYQTQISSIFPPRCCAPSEHNSVASSMSSVEPSEPSQREASSGAGGLCLIPAPFWGVKSVLGKRNVQEDAHVAQPDLLGAAGGRESAWAEQPAPFSALGRPALSFFGVFDGHGGPEASRHAADQLHKHFAAGLVRCNSSNLSPATSTAAASDASAATEAALLESCSTHSTLQDSDMTDTDSLLSAAAGGTAGWASAVRGMARLSDRYNQAVCGALREAFMRTDAALAGTEVGELVGTTAVVAAVGPRELFIASVGDSRAVLCRRGVALPLTSDHKPNRSDEMARVLSLGGKVVFKGGSHRVAGLLAMTRAIGDHFLRPFVIPEPELLALGRSPDDELLLLASDGLWDVFSCQEAVGLGLRSVMRARERGASPAAACRIGASVLARGAQERGSKDNITVLLVDLRRDAQQSACPGSVAAVLAAQCSEHPSPGASRKRSSSDGGGGSGGGISSSAAGGTPAAAAGAGAAAYRASGGGGLAGGGVDFYAAGAGKQQHAVLPPAPLPVVQQQVSHVHALARTWAQAAAALTPGRSSGGGGGGGSSTGSSRTSSQAGAAAGGGAGAASPSPTPSPGSSSGGRSSGGGRFTVQHGHQGNMPGFTPAPPQQQQQQQPAAEQQQPAFEQGSSTSDGASASSSGSSVPVQRQQAQQQQRRAPLLQPMQSAPLWRGWGATVTTSLNVTAPPPAAAAAAAVPPPPPAAAGSHAGAAAAGLVARPAAAAAAARPGSCRSHSFSSYELIGQQLGSLQQLDSSGASSVSSSGVAAVEGGSNERGGLGSPQLSVNSDGVVRPAVLTLGPAAACVGDAAAAAAAGGGAAAWGAGGAAAGLLVGGSADKPPLPPHCHARH